MRRNSSRPKNAVALRRQPKVNNSLFAYLLNISPPPKKPQPPQKPPLFSYLLTYLPNLKPPPKKSRPAYEPHMGLFKQVCTSAVVGELLNHFQGLRQGDDAEYPLMVHVQSDGSVIRFPGFAKLISYPS
jgi:hypothetical protein